jgi:hypothetical protein
MDNEAASTHHFEQRIKELKEFLGKHYASKIDLLEFREDVAVQFGKVHAGIAQVHVTIAKMETRMIKWFIATAITIAGATFGIVRYLH